MSASVREALYHSTSHWRAVSRRRRGCQCEVGAGAGGVELEVAGLVDAGVGVEDPGGAVAPEAGHLFDDPADGLGVVVGGAEVEGGGVACGVGA